MRTRSKSLPLLSIYAAVPDISNRIKQYFAELGCKLTAPTQTELTNTKLTKAEGINHFIAKLKLPLTFPKVGGRFRSK